MLQTWYDAMLTAYNSHTEPLMQLEEILYAAIDCGVKYIFLTKLDDRAINSDQRDNGNIMEYGQARDKSFSIVPELQTKGLIDGELSGPWIRILFVDIVRTSVQALESEMLLQTILNDLPGYALAGISALINTDKLLPPIHSFLLIGQSNMAGRGILNAVPPIH